MERLRNLLLAQFQILLTLQSQTLPAIQVENITVENPLLDDFDDLDKNLQSLLSVTLNAPASAFVRGRSSAHLPKLPLFRTANRFRGLLN